LFARSKFLSEFSKLLVDVVAMIVRQIPLDLHGLIQPEIAGSPLHALQRAVDGLQIAAFDVRPDRKHDLIEALEFQTSHPGRFIAHELVEPLYGAPDHPIGGNVTHAHLSADLLVRGPGFAKLHRYPLPFAGFDVFSLPCLALGNHAVFSLLPFFFHDPAVVTLHDAGVSVNTVPGYPPRSGRSGFELPKFRFQTSYPNLMRRGNGIEAGQRWLLAISRNELRHKNDKPEQRKHTGKKKKIAKKSFHALAFRSSANRCDISTGFR